MGGDRKNGAVASWQEIEKAAPDLAERVLARFAIGTNKTIATLRRDGSPRISASELEFADGEVTLGMMSGSMKLLDVRRDPRIALHSPTVDKCSCGNHDCKKVGKHPRTAHGLTDASTDATIIRDWWERWPAANVGIATGPESGVFVLDVDGEDGQASLKGLEALGHLPQTLRPLP